VTHPGDVEAGRGQDIIQVLKAAGSFDEGDHHRFGIRPL
jgi:hypothetical protein